MITRVITIAITFVFMGISVKSQNLLNNASFERGAGSLCDYMVFADDFDFYVYDWECPTAGTSDIFNKEIPNQLCWAAMPGKSGGVHNRVGSQMPRTSSRFAGIYVYHADGYREYIHAELKSKLIVGKTYCAEMYVSLADRVQQATNNLGMAFTTRRIRLYYTQPGAQTFFKHLSLKTHVLETNVIQDSLSWVKIDNHFVADSSYSHLTIGNFFQNSQTQTIAQPGRSAAWKDIGYYFIDDVSVHELPAEMISIEGTTTICEGSKANINAVADLEQMQWTTVDDPNTVVASGKILEVNPTVTTSYRVSGKVCKKLFEKTVEIKVIPFTQPNLGKDTTICLGTSVTLGAGNDYHEYQWQDNSNASELATSVAGTYGVTVKNEFGCSGHDEVLVSVKEPPKAEIGEDVIVCDQYPTVAVDLKDEESTYSWSTGEIDFSINPKVAGKYWVTVENMCGIVSDTMRIHSYDDVFIPNVISPNDDPKNDLFEILGLPPTILPTLIVTNRWGKEVVSRINYQGDWPDQKERDQLPTGVYYYSVIIPGCKSYKGWLHILR